MTLPGPGMGRTDKLRRLCQRATPIYHSPAANPIRLDLGQPALLDVFPGGEAGKSLRVQGGFVRIPSVGPLNPPEFTLEALVSPEWDLNVSGKYYCIIESSATGQQAPAQTKKVGYALYAGPDDPNYPNSPYHYQLWVGTGAAFVRLAEQKPYSKDPAKNPGPRVVPEPTYVAATLEGTQPVLYVYVPGRHFDYVKYELNPAAYSAALAPNLDLFIGITGEFRALFAPFPGPNRRMYPFSGRLAEVAVYDKALKEDRIRLHATAAFTE